MTANQPGTVAWTEWIEAARHQMACEEDSGEYGQRSGLAKRSDGSSGLQVTFIPLDRLFTHLGSVSSPSGGFRMSATEILPRIIQGGMGAAVSGWRLARAVALRGQMGVVSGTGIDTVFVRRLQDGDPGGHLRRAMAAFPIPRVAEAAQAKYFRPGGRPDGTPYAMIPMHRLGMPIRQQELLILAGFAEVWLAKEGHAGEIGINLLTKIQLPTLATLYGAMLAGVGWVLMGAGIPREIPAALDQLALHQPAALKLDIDGPAPADPVMITFEPAACWDALPPPLTRPRFLAIVASNSLATVLARKASGKVDGFVIEGPTAGGHNAPPRGRPELNDIGEPIYGPRDVVDYTQVSALGLPFWIAGGAGSPDGLVAALAIGAAGIQVGTMFAYAEESGFDAAIRSSVLGAVARREATVYTDPKASPTGYPFKVVHWPEEPVGDHPRNRNCDLGYLRVPYVKPDGGIGYRCAAEPEDQYVQKGGHLEDTIGRQCLCNGLLSVIGHAQIREGEAEPPLVTSGDDLLKMGGFLAGRDHYSADQVLDYLLRV